MAKKKNRKLECEIERMSLVELQPADYNPRKMSIEAYQGLGKSIDRFGMLVPIVWNRRSGNVVGGHQRLRYLQESGEVETDVVVVDLDDNEEVALNVTLNNRSIRGDFTVDVVAMLEKSEVQIGSAFNDVKLSDLFQDMNRRFAKELREKNKSQEPMSPSTPPPQMPPPDAASSGLTGSTDVPDTDAVIVCPKCKSRWKMKNNEVVYDARKEDV